MSSTTDTMAGFLADIIEHPEDDVPRLIFADWLDDHDQGNGLGIRADFIRAQIDGAATGHVDCPCKVHEDYQQWGPPLTNLVRCGECAFCRPMMVAEAIFGDPNLIAYLAGDGFAEAQRLLDTGFYIDCNHHSLAERGDRFPTIWYWRGMISRVKLRPKEWVRAGSVLARTHPVEYVELTGKTPQHGRFATDCYVANLAGKNFWAWYAIQPFERESYGHEREHALPHEIYSRLRGSVTPEEFSFRQYLSQGLSFQAASDAAIRWARETRR